VFLVKLDSSLSFQWVNAFGSDSPASLAESGLTVATDSYGNSFVGGAFEGTADFDPGASVENRTSTGGLDAFVVAFDSSGVFEWVDVWGGDQQDECRRISIDSDGLLAAGCFADSVDFDPGSGVDTHVSIGGEDISLSKLSTSGALLWARTCGAADDDFGNGVTNDGGGNVYFTGAFTGIVDFDPGPYLDYHSSENGKAFLARLNSQGLY
jgi:hypothetical protein